MDGLLLLDKPQGLSSNQALQQAKNLLDARKAGHTGSLDPVATGLLPLCFGETTKISGLFLDSDKRYSVRIRLGVNTETGDREGRVIDRQPVEVSRDQLDRALERFRGEFEQIPPMYSALKKDGQPLYKLARKGITVDRKARPVSVYELKLDQWQEDMLELSLSCSRGFYVRTLATDLGEALGCGAHVEELRRTGVGELSLERAYTLSQIEAIASPRDRQKCLLPTDRALAHLPEVNLPDNLAVYLCRGQSVRAATTPCLGLVRVYSPSAGFIGLGEITPDRKVAPKRLFHTI